MWFFFSFQSYSESEDSCLVCSSKNEKIVDILQSQSKKIGQEDEFHQRMETAEDKFVVVSEYMGLGVFRNNNQNQMGMSGNNKEQDNKATGTYIV